MKARSMKVLLGIVLDNKKLFSKGLCFIALALYYNDIITAKECVKLKTYIQLHRPKKGVHYDSKYHNSTYFWKPYDWAPRETWLKHKISQL